MEAEGSEVMAPDMRLVAKIYRAISEFSDEVQIDEIKCARIASLISQSEFPARLEASIEQQADRIHTMRAEETVGFLKENAARQLAAEQAEGEAVCTV